MKKESEQEDKSNEKPPGPLAVVTSYRYFDDITVFSTIDLGSGQVVGSRPPSICARRFPTDEFDEAQELAREKSDEVKQLYERFGEQITCLSAVQPVHRQGRPEGQPRRASELSRRQARPELSAPAGQPDDTQGRGSAPEPPETRAQSARRTAPAAPNENRIDTRLLACRSACCFVTRCAGAFLVLVLLRRCHPRRCAQRFFRPDAADPPAQEVTAEFLFSESGGA